MSTENKKTLKPGTEIQNIGKDVCESELYECPKCGFSKIPDEVNRIKEAIKKASTAEGKKSLEDNLNCTKCKVPLIEIHLLHNPVTGKWKKSKECSK